MSSFFTVGESDQGSGTSSAVVQTHSKTVAHYIQLAKTFSLQRRQRAEKNSSRSPTPSFSRLGKLSAKMQAARRVLTSAGILSRRGMTTAAQLAAESSKPKGSIVDTIGVYTATPIAVGVFIYDMFIAHEVRGGWRHGALAGGASSTVLSPGTQNSSNPTAVLCSVGTASVHQCSRRSHHIHILSIACFTPTSFHQPTHFYRMSLRARSLPTPTCACAPGRPSPGEQTRACSRYTSTCTPCSSKQETQQQSPAAGVAAAAWIACDRALSSLQQQLLLRQPV